MVVLSQLDAACINKRHQKIDPTEKNIDKAKKRTYFCEIKKSEETLFENGYCKKCGCYISDHNDLDKATERKNEKVVTQKQKTIAAVAATTNPVPQQRR